jgi:Rrf2 family protein
MTPRSIARARFDYAVRASLSLVRAPNGSLVKSARIADESGVPPPFLARILAALVDAGVIHSVRGANGGYRLAGPPDAISLGAILRAVDAPAFQDGDRGSHRRRPVVDPGPRVRPRPRADHAGRDRRRRGPRPSLRTATGISRHRLGRPLAPRQLRARRPVGRPHRHRSPRPGCRRGRPGAGPRPGPASHRALGRGPRSGGRRGR